MNNKLVSVVIPFYNGIDWLCEAVDSVLKQTYKNIEIIVVNDGSPENVTNFLNQYGEYIKYFYKENGGPSSARNLAISKSIGEYIALLDSDDIWLPEKTAKQISFMDESGAMWSHTGFYYWNSSTGQLKSPNISHNYDNVFLQGFITLKISTPSVIIKRTALLEHPEITFPINERYGQDSSFFRQLSYYYPLGLVEEPLMKIRLRGTNTNSRGAVRIRCNKRILDNILTGNNRIYDNIPHEIISIYDMYARRFKIIYALEHRYNWNESNIEKISKLLWIIPYITERLYVRKIIASTNKCEKYIKRKQ